MANDPADDDLPWDRWRDYIRDHLAKTGVKQDTYIRAAARLLNVTRGTVKGYLHGPGKVPFKRFAKLNEAAGLDVFVGLACLGVVPETFGTAMLEKHQLEIRNREQQEQLAQLAAASGPALVAKAVLETSGWSIGCRPVYEGPSGYEMHVANRLTLVANDRPTTSGQDLVELARRELGPALAAAGAIEIGDRGQDQYPTATEVNKSMWAVEVLDAPRPPVLGVSQATLHSIVVIGTTVHSWPDDVGSLIAHSLGFGFANDRRLAVSLFGAIAKDARHYATAFRSLTATRDSRTNYVIAGRLSDNGGEPFMASHPALDFLASNDDLRTVVVILDQTDQLIERWEAADGNTENTKQWRDALRAAAMNSRQPSIIVETNHPFAGGSEPAERSRRMAYTERAMSTASLVLANLQRSFGVTPVFAGPGVRRHSCPEGFQNFHRDYSAGFGDNLTAGYVPDRHGVGRIELVNFQR